MSGSDPLGLGPGAADRPLPLHRIAVWLHAIALVVLLGEVVYWLAQPCVGHFLCDPVLGYLLGLVAIPFVVGFVLWRAARRASVLVVWDTLVVGQAGPQLFVLPLRSLGADVPLLILTLVPFLLLGGLALLIPELVERRIERWLTEAALAAMAVWFVASGQAPNAIVPVVIGLAVEARSMERGPSSPGR